MKVLRVFYVLTALLLCSVVVCAQTKPAYEVKTIAPGIYELTIHDDSGLLLKVLASVGDDGVLLVDSGYREHGEALVEAVKKFNKGIPRFVINTHSHIEHLGGQIAFGKGPVIIGHKELRDRYINGLYVFTEFPQDAIPQITFTDSMSLFFNGEEIKLIAFPGAHDNSDTIVWFTKSKVASTEALCNCGHFPSVDGDTGDVTLYPETVEKIIRTLPEDVVLVPGHTEDCGMVEIRKFHDMLVKTREIVRTELANGKSLQQMRKEDVLAQFKSYESYMGRNDWLESLFYGLTVKKTERAGRAMPFGLLYKTEKDHGAEATIRLFNEIRANKSDTYYVTENTLLFTGRRVVRLGKYADGIRLLEYYLKEYPNGANLPLGHLGLATAHEKLGDTLDAITYYKKYLEINPEEQSVIDKVKELEKKLPQTK